MRNKKFLKLVSLLLVLMLMFSLAGCQTSEPAVENGGDVENVDNVSSADNLEDIEKDEKSNANLLRDARGSNGIVAAAKPEASEVGIEIMKKGGNAIDAAVATAFALGVVEPNGSGIGGGGFMLIKLAETGEELFYDFREVAPMNSTSDMYPLDEDGKVVGNVKNVGGLSVAVPGEVEGLLSVLEEYGSMSREEVLQPAIDFAENGYVVTENLSKVITDQFEKINRSEASKELYFRNGVPAAPGEIIKNPDLAETLRIIAKEGKDGFYKGAIAEDMVKAAQEDGGILTLEDLANYEMKIREPIRSTYRGYEVISAPPSSSGGAHVIQLLNIMENFDLKDLGHNSTESIHLWSEASKMMFADRAEYMADTDFYDVPLAGIISKDYAKELAGKIDLNKAADKVEFDDPSRFESGSTTHYSVMDKEGNMVSVTKTLNNFYGSGITVPGRGFLLNNQMDNFVAEQGKPSSVEPGKRPLSGMSPTIVLKDGEPFMTLGSPGSTRILTTVAQIISNVIDFDMDMQEAINAPRMYDMSGTLAVESRIPSEVIERLEELGHTMDVRVEFDEYFGGAQCIVIEESGELYGAGDPRRDGQAVGY